MGYSLTQNNDEVKVDVVVDGAGVAGGQRGGDQDTLGGGIEEDQDRYSVNNMVGTLGGKPTNETDAGNETGEFLAAEGLEDELMKAENGALTTLW